MSLAGFTKVKVGAVRMHTLVADSKNAFGADVTGGEMHWSFARFSGTHIVGSVPDFDEWMMGVLFAGYTETRAASVKVGALDTFITDT